MKGQCRYQLSTNQINGCYIRKWRVFIALVLVLPFISGLAWSVFQFHSGLLSGDQLFDRMAALVMGTMILTFFLFAFIRIRAGTAPTLPAGETTLDWSPSGLVVQANGEIITLRWEDVRIRLRKGDVMLWFPGGRFTCLTSKYVSDRDRASLVRARDTALQWNRGML